MYDPTALHLSQDTDGAVYVIRDGHVCLAECFGTDASGVATFAFLCHYPSGARTLLLDAHTGRTVRFGETWTESRPVQRMQAAERIVRLDVERTLRAVRHGEAMRAEALTVDRDA